MGASRSYCYYILIFIYLSSSSLIRFATSSPVTCHPQSNTFLHDLQLQCPLSISVSLPVEMDGEALEQVLNSKPVNAYTAVLFYGLWCPFSSGIKYKFDALSTMFPDIGHVAVEQSSAMPRVFSRYGIHSLPALLILNHSAEVRYHGPKDLQAMVGFYKRTTGLDPVEDLTEDISSSLTSSPKSLPPWYELSLNAMIVKEPYLVLAVLFLLLRALLYFCPGVLSRLAAVWVLYYRHLNLGIFGETRQLLLRGLHLVDIKRVYSKVKLCKTRNFLRGARSARVWASSLASVSLGETSTVSP
ncbi:5-adenylylsulfate reductase-like [Dionaea muscipula]